MFVPAAGTGIVAVPLQSLSVTEGVGPVKGKTQPGNGLVHPDNACPVLLSTKVTATCFGFTSGTASGSVGFRDLIACSWTRAHPCTVARGENVKNGGTPACVVLTSSMRLTFDGAVCVGSPSTKHSGKRSFVVWVDGEGYVWTAAVGNVLFWNAMYDE